MMGQMNEHIETTPEGSLQINGALAKRLAGSAMNDASSEKGEVNGLHL